MNKLLLLLLNISTVFCINTLLEFKYANVTYTETSEVQIVGLNQGSLNYLIIKEEDNDAEGIFKLGVMEKYRDFCKNECKLFVKPLRQTAVMNREIIQFLEYFNNEEESLIKYSAVNEITTGCVYNRTKEITKNDSLQTAPVDGFFYSNILQNVDSEILKKFENVTIQFNAVNEETPLARAEWIKFVSIFYGLEYNATRIFDAIEQSYDCNRKIIQENSGLFTKIKVAWLESFYPSKALWRMNDIIYRKNLLSDAGAEIVTEEEDSLETLQEKLKKTHFLINDTPHNNTMDSMDDFYKEFGYTKDSDLKLLKQKNILRTDGSRSTEDVSSWEEDYMAFPHLVLVDFIHWFHPSLGNIDYFGYDTGNNSTTMGYWLRNVAKRSTIHMSTNLECPSELPNVLNQKVCINVNNFKGDYSDYSMFDNGFTRMGKYMKIYWYVGVSIILVILFMVALHYFIKQYKKKEVSKRDSAFNDVKNHEFIKLEEDIF